MRKSKIYKELLKRAKEVRRNGNWCFDLDMKNGQELRVYIVGEPLTRDYNTKDFSLLDDNNKVLHFDSLLEIAEFIDKNY